MNSFTDKKEDFNVKVKFSLSIDESMGLPPKAQVRGLSLRI